MLVSTMFYVIAKKQSAVGFLILQRYLRGAAKGKDSKPRFLKGNVISLDNATGDKFGSPEDFRELNRTLRKMFVEPEEIQSEEEVNIDEDYNSVYEDRHRTFAIQEMNEVQRQKFIKGCVVKKKYFPDPKETNLLTHAAKKQLRYLHQLDPLEWTPEKLSECFPISVRGVKKFLKHKYVLDNYDEEKIKVHDAEVMKRWQMLKSNKDLSMISPVTVKLWREGKLIHDFYCGNKNLPQPPQTVIEEPRPKKVGEHLAIIKKYLDVQKQLAESKKEARSNNAISKAQPLSTAECKVEVSNIKKDILPEFQFKHPTRSEMEDQQSASYLATDKEVDLSDDPEITSSQYEENLQEEFTDKKYKTATDEAYLEWLKKQKSESESSLNPNKCPIYDGKDCVSVIKKYNETVALKTEETDSKQQVSSLCDSNLVSQYAVGESVADHIKIPQHLYKKGALYRVGSSFYSDTGEFLYKVPFAIKSKA